MKILNTSIFKRCLKIPNISFIYLRFRVNLRNKIRKKIFINLKKNLKTIIPFIVNFFPDRKEFLYYEKELIDSGLFDYIFKKKLFFENKLGNKGKTYRGNRYTFGEINQIFSICLYSIIRKKKPKILVETGVCNGVSTTIILYALHQNNKGKLYSIDFPEVEGKNKYLEDFWEGKGGAVIPKGKKPGWIIPKHLKSNWELILGKTQEKLPILLKRLKKVDFFIHDSEHSYECMWFEFNEAYNTLSQDGIIISDDINWNEAFNDICNKYNKDLIFKGEKFGIIIKQS